MCKMLKKFDPRPLRVNNLDSVNKNFADFRIKMKGETFDFDVSFTSEYYSKKVFEAKVTKHKRIINGKPVHVIPVIVHHDMTLNT